MPAPQDVTQPLASPVLFALETSGSTGSVAVLRGEELLAQRFFRKGLRHGTDLVPALDALVRRLTLHPAHARLVVVASGPGSYTGLRVGISSAKALAFALAVPLVSVPSTHAAACNLPPDPGARLAVLVDARRQTLYVALYQADGRSWSPCASHRLLTPDQAAAHIDPAIPLLGDGALRYRPTFESAGFRLLPESLATPAAGWVGRLGLRKYAALPTDELLTVQPLYLRMSEAEEKYLRWTQPL